MRYIRASLAAAAILLTGVAIPSLASAQAVPMLGISAGAAVPVGKLSDTHTTGFNTMVSLGFGGGEEIPIALRFDGSYTKFNGSTANGATIAGIRVWSGNVNAIVTVLGGEILRPYVLAGGGVFNMKSSGTGSSSTTDFGVTGGVGVGLDLSGFNTFAEARIHHIFTENGATRYVPIVFGILF